MFALSNFFSILLNSSGFVNKLIASNFSSKANFATVIDFDTGAVLYEKNANSKIYPASMGKLMTLYPIWRNSNSTYTLETEVEVSKKHGTRWFKNVSRKWS